MLGSYAANSPRPRRCAALVSSVAARFHLQHDLRNIAVLSARVVNRRGQRKTGVSVRQLRSGSRRASSADRCQQDRPLRRQMLERRHRPYPSRGHCPQPDSIVPLFSGASRRQASAADRCQQVDCYIARLRNSAILCARVVNGRGQQKTGVSVRQLRLGGE